MKKDDNFYYYPPDYCVTMNWQNNYGRNDKGEKTFICPDCKKVFTNNELDHCPFCGIRIIWHG
ncbi:hypothetical protein LCGC14_1957880 [marine sediment metagenome]|uniref:Uncharacterized protein n=1 Tax=marine sediment metagenome TaxID=412755 RepID=A0A0F9G3S4_9ZZZZ